MKAYKYTDARWENDVLSGRFRISLLTEFHKMENEKLRDELEGVSNSILPGAHLVGPGKNEDIIERLYRTQAVDLRGGGSGLIGELDITMRAPPLYVLCLCTCDNNPALLGPDGYDAIFGIEHIGELGRRLMVQNSSHLGTCTVNYVTYDQRPRDLRVENPVLSPFYKRARFSDEKEIRICWEARSEEPVRYLSCDLPEGFVRRIR